MMQYVIVVFHLTTGFEIIIGPFDDWGHAYKYINTNFANTHNASE